jgi:Xaa-Pro aminopeptidase
MSKQRLERLRARMADLDLEAMLITQAENRRYVSGFTGSTGTILVSAIHALFITDFRYYEQVGQQSPEFTLIKQTKTFKAALREAVQAAAVKNLAFESQEVSVWRYQDMRDALAAEGDGLIAELTPTADVVEPLRAVKDADEIEAIAQAAAITDAALAGALPLFAPGMTEKQAAWEIEKRMREMGAAGVGFELIVASGPNSALPHARPSKRVLAKNEPIVIDIGACVDGYVSDMTRTVWIGKPTVKYNKVYGTVLKAQLAALAAIKAGADGKAVDAVARSIITDAGYGDKFGHGLGHGVGLQVHEQPRLSPMLANPQPLVAGNLVTVEPGIYLPGWGGVRIEDLVVVTQTGLLNLSASPK